MERLKTVYTCQNCGHSSIRWMGKCPSCEKWDTFVEEVVKDSPKDASRRTASRREAVHAVSFSEVQTAETSRIKTGINEFDRLLGGGIVPGSVTLLGGEPGIGKSTLMLQVACFLSRKGVPVLYVSGEESLEQIKLRAERLGLSEENIFLLSETNADDIAAYIEKQHPRVVVMDSIQIIHIPELSSSPGTVAQVRECAGMLASIAKRSGISIFLVGHVTKTGSIAGPKVVEHIVDTVLYFEGESHNRYRILRTLKNRFGSTEEIGIFSMDADGLREVENPSDAFLAERSASVSGSIVVASMEGTRPILVELQALVSPSIFGMPERRAIGIDHGRLSVLLAVLEKRSGLRVQNQDVFVNVVGGIRLIEPAADLGTVLAIASSFKDVPVPEGSVALGEVGLGGEVRPVNHAARRVSEAERLGFKKIFIPKANAKNIKTSGIAQIIAVETVKDAVGILLGKKSQAVGK